MKTLHNIINWIGADAIHIGFWIVISFVSLALIEYLFDNFTKFKH